jgi:hypothetical protein
MASEKRSGPSSGKKAARSTSRPSAALDVYLLRSQRPLEILFFLLPLIVFYEIGLLFILRGGDTVLTNKAHEALLRVFEAFGLDGMALALPALSLPGVLLVVILLAWQALSRLPWEVDLRTVSFMAIESILLAVPLFVAAQLIAQIPAAAVAPAAMAGEEVLRRLPFLGQVAVAIGAGLYEELVFRMAAIAVLHTLFVDALSWRERPAMIAAVAIAALAFTIYHPLRAIDGAIDWRRFLSLLAAGLYFGALFAKRGFGIVVGAHAAYDIAALAVLAASEPGR